MPFHFPYIIKERYFSLNHVISEIAYAQITGRIFAIIIYIFYTFLELL